jgi:hypothetical protein
LEPAQQLAFATKVAIDFGGANANDAHAGMKLLRHDRAAARPPRERNRMSPAWRQEFLLATQLCLDPKSCRELDVIFIFLPHFSSAERPPPRRMNQWKRHAEPFDHALRLAPVGPLPSR